MPDDVRDILAEALIRERETAQEEALNRTPVYLYPTEAKQPPAFNWSPGPLWRLAGYSLVTLIVGGLCAALLLESRFFLTHVRPFAMQHGMQARVDHMGGFSPSTAWPGSVEKPLAEWQSLVKAPDAVTAFLAAAEGERDPWGKYSAPLKRACERGLVAACRDRFVAVRSGFFRDNPFAQLKTVVPAVGPASTSPELVALKAQAAERCYACEGWAGLTQLRRN